MAENKKTTKNTRKTSTRNSQKTKILQIMDTNYDYYDFDRKKYMEVEFE